MLRPACDRIVQQSRVVRFSEFGGPEVLHLDDVPIPEPGRARCACAWRSPASIRWTTRSAAAAPQYATRAAERPGPRALGSRRRDRARGRAPRRRRSRVRHRSRPGRSPTIVVAPASYFAFVPDELPMDVAGGLALAGQTAWDAIASQGLQAGDTIVVSACCGRGGRHPVAARRARGRAGDRQRVAGQPRLAAIARHRAGRVRTGTGGCGAGAAGRRRRADGGLRSARGRVGRAVPGAGGAARAHQHERDGRGRAGQRRAAGGRARIGRGPTDLATLATLAALVVDGAVEVPIAGRYPLERVAEAYTFLEAGHLRGKVVVGWRAE